jgi:hypothetical protein
MPWIRSLPVLPGLWIAWTEDDYHSMLHQRLGFTRKQAEARVLRALS